MDKLIKPKIKRQHFLLLPNYNRPFIFYIAPSSSYTYLIPSTRTLFYFEDVLLQDVSHYGDSFFNKYILKVNS